jgi:hypothetical protein
MTFLPFIFRRALIHWQILFRLNIIQHADFVYNLHDGHFVSPVAGDGRLLSENVAIQKNEHSEATCVEQIMTKPPQQKRVIFPVHQQPHQVQH